MTGRQEVIAAVRISTGPSGESMFEDIRIVGREVKSTVHNGIGVLADLQMGSALNLRRTVTESDASHPHVAPRLQMVVHLRGEAEIRVSNGDTRRFGPGDVFIVEDTTGSGHTTTQVGDVRRVVLTIPLENYEISEGDLCSVDESFR